MRKEIVPDEDQSTKYIRNNATHLTIRVKDVYLLLAHDRQSHCSHRATASNPIVRIASKSLKGFFNSIFNEQLYIIR